MEEQNKIQTTATDKTSNTGKTAAKIILGIIFIILGLFALIRWWPSLVTLIKGFIGLFLILAGAITLAVAKE